MRNKFLVNRLRTMNDDLDRIWNLIQRRILDEKARSKGTDKGSAR